MHNGVLNKASHFHAAIQNKWHVTVYQQGELLDRGGVIESQTLESVKIGDSHFLKANCEFIVGDETILEAENDGGLRLIERIGFFEDGEFHR